MPALLAVLRALACALALVLLLGAGAVTALYVGASPWWSLLSLPLLGVAWSLWRGGRALRTRRAARRRNRRPERLVEVPRDAQLAQAWHRALARSGAARDGKGSRGEGLPWFLLLGRTGCGKTTALSRARIPSPLSPVRSDAPDTGGVAWWFTDRLVLMDCGDAMPGPDAGAQSIAEWEYHLRMLRRQRRHDGVEGVVLVLSAQYLLEADTDQIGDEARAIRARLEQLIGELGRRFPVYLLITRCDTLYGFEAWVRALPAQRAQQALGYLAGVEGDLSDQDFVRQALDAVDARLRRLRWQLLADGQDGAAEILMFPLELQALRAPLQAFSDNCLATHPCLERLLLRGVFFASGEQHGGAVSRILGHDAPTAQPHGPRHQGVFLRGLFADLLPAEHGLCRPAAAVLRRRRRRTRMLLGAWLTLAGLGAFALSVSFVHNLRALDALHAAAARHEGTRGGPDEQIEALAAQEQAIRRFDRLGHAWLARLTLPGSGLQELLAGQKRQFVASCRASLGDATALEPDLPESGANATRSASAVLQRLRLSAALQAHASGAGLQQLQQLARPFAGVDGGDDTLQAQRWQLELAQIAWTSPSDPRQQARLLRTRASLDRLALQDPNMRWLARIPTLQSVAALRASDAWEPASAGPAVDAPREAALPVLAPEFTSAGYAAMRRLIDDWRTVSAEPVRVAEAWERFRSGWREGQRLAVRAALEQVVAAAPPLRGAAQWRAALPELASVDNPYWTFGDAVIRQLDAPTGAAEPAAGAGAGANQAAAAPMGWAAAAREFAAWRSEAAGGSTAHTLYAALREAGRRGSPQGAAGGAAGAARSVKGYLRGARDLRDYLAALDALARTLEQGDSQAAGVAEEFLAFGRDPKVTQSVAGSAAQALQRVVHRLQDDAAVAAPDALRMRARATDSGVFPIGGLLAAPWRALMHYANATAACNLQRRWQSDVLWPLQTAASPDDAMQQVYGPRGTLWTFLEGPAAHFLVRDAQQYRVAEKAGQKVSFTPEFLGIIDNAARRRADQQRRETRTARQQSQTQAARMQLGELRAALQAARAQHAVVVLAALPSDVVPQSAPRVFSTSLDVDCASTDTRLNNLNLPLQRSLDWSPQSCSGVRLRIALADLVLERSYPGPLGFAQFLADFPDGSHGFTPADFPLQAARLGQLGVRSILLHYRVQGAEAALRVADSVRRLEQREQQLQATLGRLQPQPGLDTAPAPRPDGPGAAAEAPGTAAPPPGAPAWRATPGLPAQITVCWDDGPVTG